MATPTKAQGVSTPRNPLTSTPNRTAASPRPNSSALHNRPFSYKSPAVKTPASGQGYSHRISISSQPMSTPLIAPAIHDELLNLNSPAAALIASMGTTGLTPLPSGQDGLGITTGITPTPVADVSLPRNPDLERAQRIQAVAQTLETRSLGRGITRDRIKQLAHKEKFDQQWDGDSVNIAGVSVDLEIAFNSNRKDLVRDVTLNLVTQENGDAQLQETASKMLKKQLVNTTDPDFESSWTDPALFARNLHYLGHHDRIDCPVNCFQLIQGLSQTLQRIWGEEKKRMRERHNALHVCQGNVGQPSVDVGTRLGLSTKYWIQKHSFVAATRPTDWVGDDDYPTWSAHFSVDPGQPSVTSNQDWLASDPLVTSGTTEDLFQERQVERPNWQDVGQNASESKPEKDLEADVMNIDEPNSQLPKSLDVQFCCEFEPSVLIPVPVITTLNSQTTILQVDQDRMTTFQQALMNDATTSFPPTPIDVETVRLNKSVAMYSKDGVLTQHEHAYLLLQNSATWCCPVTQLRFCHPRYFAEAIPIFRQYAMLWSLLRSTVVEQKSPKTGVRVTKVDKDSSTGSAAAGVTRRSNRKPAQIELNQLLSPTYSQTRVLNIDIVLDLESDATKVKLGILIPSKGPGFIQVGIEIQRHGILQVTTVTGPGLSTRGRLTEQATKVLDLSEDIGVLAQWLLHVSPRKK